MATKHHPGDSIAIPFEVRDSTNTLADPSEVLFHYTDPLGADATKVYGVDTDVVSRTSTGIYRLLIYIPYSTNSYGRWHYDGQARDGSGNSLTVSRGYFDVTRLETLE